MGSVIFSLFNYTFLFSTYCLFQAPQAYQLTSKVDDTSAISAYFELVSPMPLGVQSSTFWCSTDCTVQVWMQRIVMNLYKMVE